MRGGVLVDPVFLFTGIFVTTSETNPTITILALALRAAEYLAEEMRKGNL